MEFIKQIDFKPDFEVRGGTTQSVYRPGGNHSPPTQYLGYYVRTQVPCRTGSPPRRRHIRRDPGTASYERTLRTNLEDRGNGSWNSVGRCGMRACTTSDDFPERTLSFFEKPKSEGLEAGTRPDGYASKEGTKPDSV